MVGIIINHIALPQAVQQEGDYNYGKGEEKNRQLQTSIKTG